VEDSGCLLIQLLQAFTAEVDVENFFAGLGSLGMAPRDRTTTLSRGQRWGAAKVLAHQGKSSTGDERKADQIDSSQKVVQRRKALANILV
jgi:hypothetical protein